MAAAYRDLADQSNADDLSRDEWLGLMLDREAAMRADKRLTNRLAVARLRFVDACIDTSTSPRIAGSTGTIRCRWPKAPG